MTLVGPDAALAHVRSAEADLRAAGRLTGSLDYAEGDEVARATSSSSPSPSRLPRRPPPPCARGGGGSGRGRRRGPRRRPGTAPCAGPWAARDPRDVPAAEAEPSLHDGVAAQVVDPARRRVVDVEHPVAVAGEDEHDVARAHRVADVEQRRLPLGDDVDERVERPDEARPRRRCAARRACTRAAPGRTRLELAHAPPRRRAEPPRPRDVRASTCGEDTVGAPHDDPLVGREALALGVARRASREARAPVRIHDAKSGSTSMRATVRHAEPHVTGDCCTGPVSPARSR